MAWFQGNVFCLLLVLKLIAGASEITPNVIIRDTIKYLNEGEKTIKLPTNNQNAILIVGNTGAGKSTLAHYIAGNLTELKSIPSSGDSLETDFLIEDSHDKISSGASTTVSKTIFPELIIDEDKYVWYDCPGFSDTRNSSIEIAIAYFIKNVVDNVQNLKIVFAVNHASVTKGYDRIDFDRMIKHGAQFIKNVDRYNLSLALVVNKVDALRIHGRQVVQIPEYRIVNSVARFLTNYLRGLERTEGTELEQKIVKALLRKSENGTYTQIGVSWRPNEPGTLDTMDLMVKGRKSLRDMVTKRMDYSKASDDDFGFALSEKAEIDVVQLSSTLTKNITEALKNIGDEIKSFYDRQQLTLKSFADRKKLLERADSKFAAVATKVNASTLSELLNNLINLTHELQINISDQTFATIANQQKYLCFLQKISSNAMKLSPVEWFASFDHCLDYIRNERNWNDFLIDLFASLSAYDVQQDRTLFNVANISDWGKPNRTQGISINSDNLGEFLKMQKGYYDLLRDFTPTYQKFDDLNGVLNVTLKHQKSIQCDADQMIVKGEFIKLSEIDLLRCGSDVKQFSFLAFSTLFVDSDLDLRDNRTPLFVIAYKWEVVKNSTIYLNEINESDSSTPLFLGLAKEFVSGVRSLNVRPCFIITSNGIKESAPVKTIDKCKFSLIADVDANEKLHKESTVSEATNSDQQLETIRNSSYTEIAINIYKKSLRENINVGNRVQNLEDFYEELSKYKNIVS